MSSFYNAAANNLEKPYIILNFLINFLILI